MDDGGKEKGKARQVGYILNIIILHHIAKLSKLGVHIALYAKLYSFAHS